MVDSTHHNSYRRSDWQQVPYHQDYYSTRYGNEVLALPAPRHSYVSETPRAQPSSLLPYQQPSNTNAVVYKPEVYQDSRGRLYAVDAYGRSRWV
jgi:hypothetical protein